MRIHNYHLDKMKKILTLFLQLAVVLICYSQSQEELRDQIKPLQIQLQNASHDTTRVRVIKDIFSNYVNLSNLDSGLYYGFKMLNLSRKIGSYDNELFALLGIQIVLRHNGMIVKAFNIAHIGLQLAVKNKAPNFRANFMGEIGILYRESGNFSKALTYLKESKRLYDSLHEVNYSAYQLNNIGEVFLKQNKLDSALFYCQSVTPNTNIPWIIFYTSVNLGKIYNRKKEFSSSLTHLKKAEQIAVYNSHFFDTYITLAETFQLMGNSDSAYYYSFKALQIAQEHKIYAFAADANLFHSNLFKNSDLKKALEYNQTAFIYKDSLYKQSVNLALENFDEFDEREKQREIHAAKTVYQFRVRLYGLLVGLGVLIVVTFILFRNNKQKQKANRLLLKQKAEINNQREQVEKMLMDLKSTQSQLIQSEKMASLGELTAGIAHEIQNPLNFVNNFSEVSSELIDEMKTELETGNLQLATEISNDLKQNLEKINHHGKRAADIVKGMLQHSRSSSGVKEPTNINALADEYLRMAYHGLRAKDKSFNAKFEIHLDPTLPKVNVIPQDIGRVILNLITNAFYAVNERQKLLATSRELLANYEPTVSVSTKKEGNKVLILVKDNGNGIPQKVLDKIFQPFFTTKPTGQGTGLGLSLSYDIVKAHGGELKVDTKESVGSEFMIQLPVV